MAIGTRSGNAYEYLPIRKGQLLLLAVVELNLNYNKNKKKRQIKSLKINDEDSYIDCLER